MPFDGGNDKVVPEERGYIEKFGIKLGEWLPVEKEMSKSFIPLRKEV